MTTLDRDRDLQDATVAFTAVFEEFVKDIHTILPGQVVSYDPDTQRAVVTPGYHLHMKDGRVLPRPPIADVPVVWFSAGGHTIHSRLQEGDNVVLMVSERGMDRWKVDQVPGESSATMFSLKDAMAMPGFPAMSWTRVDYDGLVIQSENGMTSVRVGEDEIRLHVGTNVLVLDSGGLRYNGRNVETV